MYFCADQMRRMRKILALLFCLLFQLAWAQTGDLSFSHEGGICNAAFYLKLTAASGEKIYYTTDGSQATQDSKLYKDEIRIAKTTVLCMASYQQNELTAQACRSFLFETPTHLPVICLSTAKGNLFDPVSGIYSKGVNADSIPPYFGANFWKKRRERATYIEMYDEQGDLVVDQQVGIRIFGGFSRSLPQKSFSVYARKSYGKKRIEYQFFPDKDIKKFKSIVLRNGGSDNRGAFIRDPLMTSLVSDLDLEMQSWRSCVVYINGEYWGVYNIREKIGKHFIQNNTGVSRDSIHLLEKNDITIEGSRRDYKQLLRYIRSHSLEDNTYYNYVASQIDIDNYINYISSQIYFDNRDAGGNIRYWKAKTDTSKWRWILYDTDFGFGKYNKKAYMQNSLNKHTLNSGEKWPYPAWSTFLLRHLLKNEGFKKQFILRMEDHLNTRFHPDRVLAKIDEIVGHLEAEMPRHLERWGLKEDKWRDELDVLRDFARNRPSYMMGFMKDHFKLSDPQLWSIRINDKAYGSLRLNTVTLEKDLMQALYFPEYENELEAIPNEGYDFIAWVCNGDTVKDKILRKKADYPMDITAVFKQRPLSDLSGKLVINEIFPFGGGKGDWVEFYNNSDRSISLEGMLFKDSKHSYKITSKKRVAAGDYVVLSNYEKGSTFNDAKQEYFDLFPFGLSSKGERLSIWDRRGMLIDSLRYTSIVKDTLLSFSLRHPDLANEDADSWDLTALTTPGAINEKWRSELEAAARAAKAKKQKQMIWGGVGIVSFAGVLSLAYYFRRKRK